MKVLISFFVVCALLGFSQAVIVSIHGDIENHRFIDREEAFTAAVRDNYVVKGVTFKAGSGGVQRNITFYRQIDLTDYTPQVDIRSGGIGSTHVVMMVTSEWDKPIVTTFEFYGDYIY